MLKWHLLQSVVCHKTVQQSAASQWWWNAAQRNVMTPTMAVRRWHTVLPPSECDIQTNGRTDEWIAAWSAPLSCSSLDRCMVAKSAGRDRYTPERQRACSMCGCDVCSHAGNSIIDTSNVQSFRRALLPRNHYLQRDFWPIPWGHSGPLCHALSLLLLLMLWTSHAAPVL